MAPRTDRLYYHNSYLTSFTANIVERQSDSGQQVIILDRTAFYPSSGGQLADHGHIVGIPIADVVDAGDVIQHVLRRPVPDGVTEVTGLIDWVRRFDHMQQHTGQHILSQAFQRAIGARTVSFHLGSGYSTIDLDRSEVTWDELGEAENDANNLAIKNVPVRVHFVEPDELEQFQLRKPSERTGTIRVVEVADYDVSACGGTHVANSAEVGTIKVRRFERRGQTTRVEFVCGLRALADYHRLATVGRSIADLLNTRLEDVPAAIQRLVAIRESLNDEVEQLRRSLIEYEAADLVATATIRGEKRIVAKELVDRSIDQARLLAIAISRYGAFALIAVRGNRPQLIFVRPNERPDDMAALLRETLTKFGGRGGGTPALAQGALANAANLSESLGFAELHL